MSQLQIRLFGPDLCSFSAHSYSYALSNEPKSGLKLPTFRFGPDSPTGSQYGTLADEFQNPLTVFQGNPIFNGQ